MDRQFPKQNVLYFAMLCSPITGNVGTNANFTISKRTTRNYVKFSKSLQCILRAHEHKTKNC